MMEGVGRGLGDESKRYVYCVRSGEVLGVSETSWGVWGGLGVTSSGVLLELKEGGARPCWRFGATRATTNRQRARPPGKYVPRFPLWCVSLNVAWVQYRTSGHEECVVVCRGTNAFKFQFGAV